MPVSKRRIVASSSPSAYLEAEVEALKAEVAIRIASQEFVVFTCSGRSEDHEGGEREDAGDNLHVVWVFGSVLGTFELSKMSVG
jgi:hypothetical protein